MGSLQLGFAHGIEAHEASGARNQLRWYAAYTFPHHEKKVAEQVRLRSFECFLPLYEVFRRWKDRRRRLQLPLFPSYVFVRLELCDRLRVLRVPSVVRLVGFNGVPTAIPDDDMQAFRNSLASGVLAQPCPYLTVGQRVRVMTGPLQGMQGIYVRNKNRSRLVVSLDLIKRSISLEIDSEYVDPVTGIRN
jgi:transcription termination/antitermination protein NusG